MQPAASKSGGVLLDSRKPRAEKHTPSAIAAVAARQYGVVTLAQLHAAVAARQYGVVTLAQLHAAGLSRSAITRRVASGHLHRVHVMVRAHGRHCASPDDDVYRRPTDVARRTLAALGG